MATTSLSLELIDARLKMLERRLARKNVWILLSIVLNLLLVAAALYHFGFRFASRTLEANRILLTDPSKRVLAVLGVDNSWGNVPLGSYYPGIEFRDKNGDMKMLLFGTGASFFEGDSHASFGFTGLSVSDKDGQISLNPKIFSFMTAHGQFMLFPHQNGLNLTLGNGENEFGVVTDSQLASMYVASRGWEFDVQADKNGAKFIRGKKQH